MREPRPLLRAMVSVVALSCDSIRTLQSGTALRQVVDCLIQRATLKVLQEEWDSRPPSAATNSGRGRPA